MEYMRAGGAIMWVILFMSVTAFAFVIERVIFFAVSSTNPEAIEREFEDTSPRGRRRSSRSMFDEARRNWDAGDDAMKQLLEQQIRRELYRWERHFSILEITAKVSPLLGLLGTVLGMVEMFRTLNLGGSVDAAAVTGGIWKALFTTVAGLSAAIPVIIAHGILRGRVDREEETLMRAADYVIARRSKDGKGRDAA
jgi:biopolymer transport protein ExbB